MSTAAPEPPEWIDLDAVKESSDATLANIKMLSEKLEKRESSPKVSGWQRELDAQTKAYLRKQELLGSDYRS